jgi:hypothetical protein
MKFRLEVGDTQKHVLEYSYSQLRGELVIRLNHEQVFRQKRRFNEPLQEQHLVRVEESGALDVLIEKERRPLFGHRYRVFLNGRLYKSYARDWNPLHLLTQALPRKGARLAPAGSDLLTRHLAPGPIEEVT